MTTRSGAADDRVPPGSPPRRRAPGAGRKCQVCIHADRALIDRAICAGNSRRTIGERYNVPPDAVWRHGRLHLTPEMRAAIGQKLIGREEDLRVAVIEETDGLVGSLKAIRSPLFRLFLGAVECQNGKLAAALSGRLHENLAMAAKVTGEIAPHAGISITNVLLSPDFLRLRQMLLSALRRHPEAARDVAEIFSRASEHAAQQIAGPPTIDAV